LQLNFQYVCVQMCVIKSSILKKSVLIYCLLSEIYKISTTKDNRQYAHAWDYCILTKWNYIPLCVGYCLLFGSRYCRTSDKTTFNSSHAFSFTQVLTACFWETVSSKKFVYDISEVDETLMLSNNPINIK